jgi:hypothetical protein
MLNAEEFDNDCKNSKNNSQYANQAVTKRPAAAWLRAIGEKLYP